MAIEQRFPNIDWFCDNCRAHLNTQSNFDDRKHVWKCQKCGYKVVIDRSNIIDPGDNLFFRVLGKALGLFRCISLYTGIIMLIAHFCFDTDFAEIPRWMLITIIMYPLLCGFSLFFERVIMNYRDGDGIVFLLAYYIYDDIFRPFREAFSIFRTVYNLFRIQPKGKGIVTIILNLLYICIIIYAVLLFNKLTYTTLMIGKT